MSGKTWLICAVLFFSAGVVAADTPAEAYGRLPLSFEANAGQTDPAVRFLSRGPGYTLFLTSAEAVLRLNGPEHEDAVVRLRLAGGKRAPRLDGLEPQATRSNYLLGNDPQEWYTGVPHYARVRYENVYPGIDLIYHGNQRQLEYDFVLAPGADPRRIRLDFQGADRLTIGDRGELIVHTAQGDLVQHPPVVYQEIGGERRPVEGRYVLHARRRVGFALGRYDRGRPLVIDPVLAYSTFLGGGGFDAPSAIAVDGAGNAYIAGSTSSIDFPGTAGSSIQPVYFGGASDAFVTKINAAGTAIVYSTYLGGTGGDYAWSLAVDSTGNAYLTGRTESTDFPGTGSSQIQSAYGGGIADGFVTKINAAGTAIVYSTYLGGSGFEQSHDIAVDGAGNAYVAGRTQSTTFPGVGAGSLQPSYGGGNYDTFLTKINAAGTAIVYSTFLGGSGSDYPDGVAVDGTGNAYVTGTTDSATFPGVDGSSIQPAQGGACADAFVTKVDAAGTAIVYSTFLGGSGCDGGLGIAVDGGGNTYVTGGSNSATFPGVGGSSIQPANSGGGDGFVTKINAAGTAIVYSTFLGGGGSDASSRIAVDNAGNAYVTGSTDSTTFPGVDAGSLQPVHGGIDDAFVTKIDAAGTAIVYSTFLGGSFSDSGAGIAVDAAGNTYVTGFTQSTTFPGVNAGSLLPANTDQMDGFVTKIGGGDLEFFTVEPCRLIDTRNAAGPLGGPALQPSAARLFVVTGACGVPFSAKALSVNVTVTQPAAAGYLQLLPGGPSIVTVSTINFSAGQTRANNAVVPLASDGSGGLQVTNGSAGSVHFLLDVNGYFAVPVP